VKDVPQAWPTREGLATRSMLVTLKAVDEAGMHGPRGARRSEVYAFGDVTITPPRPGAVLSAGNWPDQLNA
jgi:hypothetical protein